MVFRIIIVLAGTGLVQRLKSFASFIACIFSSPGISCFFHSSGSVLTQLELPSAGAVLGPAVVAPEAQQGCLQLHQAPAGNKPCLILLVCLAVQLMWLKPVLLSLWSWTSSC